MKTLVVNFEHTSNISLMNFLICLATTNKHAICNIITDIHGIFVITKEVRALIVSSR